MDSLKLAQTPSGQTEEAAADLESSTSSPRHDAMRYIDLTDLTGQGLLTTV